MKIDNLEKIVLKQVERVFCLKKVYFYAKSLQLWNFWRFGFRPKIPQLWNSQLWNLTVFVIWGQNQGCTIGLVSESDTNPIRIGLVIGRTRPRKFWPVRLVNWFQLVNWYPIGRSASSSDRIKRDRTIPRTWVDKCRPIKFQAFLINKRPSNAQKLFF